MTSYIYEDTEVRLTGREATKQIGSGVSRRANSRANVDIKVEITPNDITTGAWKKWVSKDDLYTILETDDE